VSPGERCDTAIAKGMSGACPTSCAAPGDPCRRSNLRGSRCDAQCEETKVTARVDGDRCCPDNAHSEDDADCEVSCGNGRVEAGETCERDGDPRCPESCDDADVCTEDVRSGNEADCDVKCTHMARMPGGADGCCPNGATSISDPDCAVDCGNGLPEAGEECDDGNKAAGDGCDAACAVEMPPEPTQTCENLGSGDLCSLCTCAQCGARSGGCTSLFPSTRVQKCLAVSSCIREKECEIVECYCGSDLNSCLSGKPSGPCQAEIVSAGGSSEVQVVVAELRDERAPLARALRQSQCESRQCGAVCGNR
jgi:large repetitive protein